MTKAYRLKTRKPSGLAKGVPVNFLLGCSELSLGSFVLARYAEASDVRKELLAIIDRLIEQMMMARLGGWFRDTDRNVIKAAVENPIDVMAWVAEEIRNQGRGEDEIGENSYLIPLPSLPPGAAHLAAAVRYQERNKEGTYLRRRKQRLPVYRRHSGEHAWQAAGDFGFA